MSAKNDFTLIYRNSSGFESYLPNFSIHRIFQYFDVGTNRVMLLVAIGTEANHIAVRGSMMTDYKEFSVIIVKVWPARRA